MRELTHREMQLAELSILLDFREICEKNGLDMHLMSGTLLGAIRHKGFIPWDDDIDVCLSRPEYDKLIEIFKNGVDKDYLELLSFETGNFNRTFIKIIDKRTYVDNSDSFLNDGNAESLWIDVFPIDGFPANDRKAELVCKVLAILRTLIHLQNACFERFIVKVAASALGIALDHTHNGFVVQHLFHDGHHFAAKGLYIDRDGNSGIKLNPVKLKRTGLRIAYVGRLLGGFHDPG